MFVQAVAGAAVAAGLGLAGLLGASPAQALGLSVDVNGDGKSLDIGSGATTSQTGNASNNPSLAVSVLGNASTSASGNATGNTLVAIDGQVKATGNAERNLVGTIGGQSEVGGDATGNALLSVGGDVKAEGKTAGVTSLSVCGTELTAQGAVKVNPLKGGC